MGEGGQGGGPPRGGGEAAEPTPIAAVQPGTAPTTPVYAAGREADASLGASQPQQASPSIPIYVVCGAAEAPQQTAGEEPAGGPVVGGAGSGGKGGGGMGGVDGGSGLLRSRSRSRGSFRPGQRQPDSTLREAELRAAARRLLAGGLTGQLLRLAAAELGSSAWANEIAAIMEAGSQRAAPSGRSPRTAGTEPRCFVRLPSQRGVEIEDSQEARS